MKKNVHISTKAGGISLCIAAQLAMMVFILSIGYAIVYGGDFGVSFGDDRLIILQPKEGKMELVKEILRQDHEEIQGIYEGNIQNAKTNLLLFSTQGTPCLILSKEDIELFAEGFGITLGAGAFPQKNNEIVLTSPSMNVEKAHIGNWIGLGEVNFSMLLHRYQVTGIIESEKNVFLCCSDEIPEKLIVVLKTKKQDQLLNLLKQHEEWLEMNRRDDYSRSHFVERLKDNLSKIGVIMVGLLSLQLWATISSLMRVYLIEKLKEIGLYWCIGYSLVGLKKRLYKKYLIILASGGILGLLSGLIFNLLFYYMFCEIRGIPYVIFKLFFILVPIVVLCMVAFLSGNMIEKMIKRADWLEMIAK